MTRQTDDLDVEWVADCRECTWSAHGPVENRINDKADIHEATNKGHRCDVEPVTPEGEPPC